MGHNAIGNCLALTESVHNWYQVASIKNEQENDKLYLLLFCVYVLLLQYCCIQVGVGLVTYTDVGYVVLFLYIEDKKMSIDYHYASARKNLLS